MGLAQKIFESAYKQAGIKKEVTVHFPRHGYATHLLERAVVVGHIQGLLGHES